MRRTAVLLSGATSPPTGLACLPTWPFCLKDFSHKPGSDSILRLRHAKLLNTEHFVMHLCSGIMGLGVKTTAAGAASSRGSERLLLLNAGDLNAAAGALT